MLDRIMEAADRVRADILQHAHVSRDRGYYTQDARAGYDPDMFVAHPLDPTGAGGKLALFVVEALCLIIGSQQHMQDQINRLNSLLDTIGSRLGNVTTDLQSLLAHVQDAANPDTETAADLTTIGDRLQGIVDRIGTIDSAITNASSPVAQAQPGSTANPTPPDSSSDQASSPSDSTQSSSDSGQSTSEPSSTTSSNAAGDGVELAPGA